MNRVVSYCQRGARLRGICCLLRGKSRFNQLYITNKMECFSFKSGRAVRVAKLTKQDWPIVLHTG